jgi:dynein heavy chain
LILISAQGPQEQNAPKRADDKNQDKGWYSCPVYKYPRRNDKYLVVRIMLKGEGQTQVQTGKESLAPKLIKPEVNWKLKGVTLLCYKE